MKSLFVLVLLVSCLFTPLYAQKEQDSIESKIIYTVETMPTFPGGYEALLQFIDKNLNRRRADCSGNVFISFVVNENGSLTDLSVLKGIHESCDNASLELFKKMPAWIPGKREGKAVKTRMVFPVKFVYP